VTKPLEGRQPFSGFNRPEDELGSLIREVVIPSGTTPFDVGKLTVPMRAGNIEKRVPLQFEAQTLDGKPFSTTEFKGRYVLLTFWAAWSQRSLEQMESLQKLSREYRNEPRLTFAGISIDEDTDKARKIAQEHGFTGKQCWLDKVQRAKITEAFDINNLPAIFLLDPEGKIINRDLEGERIRTSLQRALSKN
jgi:peroxiredoxin